MAHLSAGTFLMKGTKGDTGTITYTKLADITDTPDLGAAPATVDVTTLSDYMHKYIAGLLDTSQLQFNGFLDEDTVELVKAGTSETQPLAVWFGGEKEGDHMKPTGSILKAEFEGQISVIVTGASVDAAIPVQITVTVNSAITYGAA